MNKRIYILLVSILLFAISANSSDALSDAVANINKGHYNEASELLKKAVNADSNNFEAMLLLLKVSDITGDRRTILRYRHLLKNLYSSGKLTSAAGLTAYAQAVKNIDPKGAFLLLDKAHKNNPEYLDAYLIAGDLCYERYAWGRAGEEYRNALKIDPENSEAIAGLAVLELASGNIGAAETRLKQGLAKHPEAVKLLLPYAYLTMLTRNYDKSIQILDKASNINPNNIELNSLYAAVYEIKGNTEKRDKYIEKVLSVNSSYVELYNTIASAAEQKYRFKDAVKWAEKGIELNPDNWRGYFIAGNNLLHLGEEKKGYQLLEKSFQENSFNILAYNILKVVDRDFQRHEVQTFETAHFAVKMPKSDAPVIWPYLKPLLEKTYNRFTKQFAIEPVGAKEHKGKILVHILADHTEFSTRTMGLPGISANGVCFGQVLLMPSPRYTSIGDTKGMDWKSVFEHEFLHILTLQKSDYRISRWFTEGISSFEESDLHGDWKTLFCMADKKEKLLPIEKLESGFFTPAYPMQVPVSYYQAAMVCKYFIDKYGDKSLNDMIDLYRDGKNTKEVVEKVSGQNLDALNKSLKSFYDKQAKKAEEFIKSFKSEIKKAEAEYKLDKKDKKNREISGHPREWENIVKTWRGNGKSDEAATLLEKLITFDDSDFKVFKLLSEIYMDKKEWGKAEEYLMQTIYRNPFNSEIHQMAATCYRELKMPEKENREKKVISELGSSLVH